jgi:two-component system OmpR family response regulator
VNKPVHKVLIIDDDSDFAEHLAGLMPSHYQVKTVYSSKQAMEQLTRYPFDSIVSDFVLAECDGFELLKAIHFLTCPPKVVFITAFANKEMAISLLNLGVHGLLEKPFPVSTLTDLLDKETENKITKTWRLDPSTRTMTTTAGDFELTEVEFKVVSYLLSNLGKWISREELVEQVWGKENRSRNVLDTHLTNLKRKIPVLRDTLKVVRGRGYLLEEIRP